MHIWPMKGFIISLTLVVLFLAASCGNNKSNMNNASADSATKAIKQDTLKMVMKPSVPPLVVKIDSVANTADFSVAVPKGWTQKENEMNGYKMLFLVAPAAGNFKSNLNILEDKMTGKGLDDYVSNNLKKMAAMQVKKTRESNIQVNGITGKSISYLYNYKGHDLAIKTYVLPVNKAVYVLTATCPLSEAKTISPVFDKIVSTFKVKPAAY